MNSTTPILPNREVLWENIKNNHLDKYTLKELEKGMLQVGRKKNNLYHEAARDGYLKNIPKALLTHKVLTKPNSHGWTCFHLAAYGGHLTHIPNEFLTDKNLLQPNTHGENSFHKAVYYNKLHQIPPLSYTTLKAAAAYFENPTSEEQEEILAFLQEKTQKIERDLKILKKSLKQNHQKIL
jgi:hypothetical protein